MPVTIDAELAELRSHALLRQLREIDSPQQPSLEFAGKKLINFSSNDYLGLASDVRLKQAARAAIDQYGVGSGASRLVCCGVHAAAQRPRPSVFRASTDAADAACRPLQR